MSGVFGDMRRSSSSLFHRTSSTFAPTSGGLAASRQQSLQLFTPLSTVGLPAPATIVTAAAAQFGAVVCAAAPSQLLVVHLERQEAAAHGPATLLQRALASGPGALRLSPHVKTVATERPAPTALVAVPLPPSQQQSAQGVDATLVCVGAADGAVDCYAVASASGVEAAVTPLCRFPGDDDAVAAIAAFSSADAGYAFVGVATAGGRLSLYRTHDIMAAGGAVPAPVAVLDETDGLYSPCSPAAAIVRVSALSSTTVGTEGHAGGAGGSAPVSDGVCPAFAVAYDDGTVLRVDLVAGDRPSFRCALLMDGRGFSSPGAVNTADVIVPPRSIAGPSGAPWHALCLVGGADAWCAVARCPLSTPQGPEEAPEVRRTLTQHSVGAACWVGDGSTAVFTHGHDVLTTQWAADTVAGTGGLRPLKLLHHFPLPVGGVCGVPVAGAADGGVKVCLVATDRLLHLVSI